MKILISFFLISILTSCQSVNYLGSDAFTSNKGNGFFVSQVNSIFDLGATCCDSIEYRPYELLVSQARKSAANQMISESELDSQFQRIPKGGQILVSISRSTISAANTKYFTFILTEGDREVARETGFDMIPNLPALGSDLWYGFHLININEPFDNEISLFVVDNLSTTRNEFLISKPSDEQYIEYQQYWNW